MKKEIDDLAFELGIKKKPDLRQKEEKLRPYLNKYRKMKEDIKKKIKRNLDEDLKRKSADIKKFVLIEKNLFKSAPIDKQLHIYIHNSKRAYYPDAVLFIKSAKNNITNKIRRHLKKIGSVEIIIFLKTQFYHSREAAYFYKDFKQQIKIYNIFDLGEFMDKLGLIYSNLIEEALISGAPSGLIFDGINGIRVELSGVGNLNGGYFRELPATLRNKKCCINVQSKEEDNKCLIYSILASIFNISCHPERLAYYKKKYDENNPLHKKIYEIKNNNFNQLKQGEELYKFLRLPKKYFYVDGCIKYKIGDKIYDGINVNDLEDVSKLNQININAFKFDVIGSKFNTMAKKEADLDNYLESPEYDEEKYEEKYKEWVKISLSNNEEKARYKIYPLYGKKNYSKEWHNFNVCYYIDHFVSIKNFNRFISNDKHRKKLKEGEKYCFNCLAVYKDDTHTNFCYNNKEQIAKMPKRFMKAEEEEEEEYKEIFNEFKYYKPEKTKLEPKDEIKLNLNFTGDKLELSFKLVKSKTEKIKVDTKDYMYQKNILVCDFESTLNPEEDKNIISFHNSVAYQLTGIDTETGEIWHDKNYIGPDAHKHLLSILLSKEFLKLVNSKLIGVYRQVPLFFHNGSGYDTNYIISALGPYTKVRRDVISRGNTKYISISFSKYKILDSCCFLSCSLSTLISNLEDKKILEAKIKGFRGSKELFPYEWFDNIDKLNSTELPAPIYWGSKLTGRSGLNREEWAAVVEVWRKRKMKTFKDYLEYYLKIDVYGLCDVLINFRNLALRDHKLDPFNSITMPSYGWRAMLKMTQAKFEIINDVNMYMFFERMIRGGLTQVSKKKMITTGTNKELHYVDANNLYGLAMVMDLPYKNFRWLSPYLISKYQKNIMAVKDCILEVDLKIPEELHDKFNGLPPCPEKKTIKKNMLSPVCSAMVRDVDKIKSLIEERKIMKSGYITLDTKERIKAIDKELKEEYDKPVFYKNNVKLICDLHDKKNYVVHIEALKFYLSIGVKLVKIHKGVRFSSYPFIKKWIEFNTERRKKAKNKFESKFSKDNNNCIFGKTMEDVRNHSLTKFISDYKKYHLYKKRYIYSGINIIDEEHDYIQMNLKRREVKLNKPIYLGGSILDLSKKHMYNMYYNVLYKKYGEKFELGYTDTDSFIFTVEPYKESFIEDIIEDENLKDVFDFSNFSGKYEKYKDTKNKKVLGKFKFEKFDCTTFYGLKAKMYALDGWDEETNKPTLKAKGITKPVIKKFNMEYYGDVLDGQKVEKFENVGIRKTKDCKLTTYRTMKSGLSSYDDKRYLLKDGVNTRAYGHYKNE